MGIIKKKCLVNTSAKAEFGEREFLFDLPVGSGQNLVDFAKDLQALGIHESHIKLFWSQYVTDAQNVVRPFLRTEKDFKTAADKGAAALAKHLEGFKKPAGEGREVSEATAKRRQADRQQSAINQLGADVRSGNADAKQVQMAIVQSKSGLGCLNEVAVEYVTKGAAAAVALAKTK